MWPVAVTYIALICLVVSVIALIVEIAKWRTSRRILTRKHRIIRLCAGMMLIALLCMIILGGRVDLSFNPLSLILYWGICMILIILLIMAALFDIRETIVAYAMQHVELTRSVLEEEKRNRQTP